MAIIKHTADHEWEYQVSLVDRKDPTMEWVEEATTVGLTLKDAVASCKQWAKSVAGDNNAKVDWYHASCLEENCEHHEGDGDSL